MSASSTFERDLRARAPHKRRHRRGPARGQATDEDARAGDPGGAAYVVSTMHAAHPDLQFTVHDLIAKPTASRSPGALGGREARSHAGARSLSA